MKKMSEKRIQELVDEVDIAFHALHLGNIKTFMDRLFRKVKEGKTDIELFYCGLIADNILEDHLELEEEEEEEKTVYGDHTKKTYIN